MTTWKTAPGVVSFKRRGGHIVPVCRAPVRVDRDGDRDGVGAVVFFEAPARTAGHFTTSVVRFTMQCVYSGEIVFPCCFNTDINERTKKNLALKVFFDQVFDKSTFRRNVTDRLATALMDQCEEPFLFKALGAFPRHETDFNCLRVSFLTG